MRMTSTLYSQTRTPIDYRGFKGPEWRVWTFQLISYKKTFLIITFQSVCDWSPSSQAAIEMWKSAYRDLRRLLSDAKRLRSKCLKAKCQITTPAGNSWYCRCADGFQPKKESEYKWAHRRPRAQAALTTKLMYEGRNDHFIGLGCKNIFFNYFFHVTYLCPHQQHFS